MSLTPSESGYFITSFTIIMIIIIIVLLFILFFWGEGGGGGLRAFTGFKARVKGSQL